MLIDDEISGSTLNVAHYIVGTRTLGPGLRSAVWVQGCPFNCSGCYSQEYRVKKTGKLFSPNEIARVLTSDPAITGITISGGEPMTQSASLVKMVEFARFLRKDLDIILYSGYKKNFIDHLPPEHSKRKLMNLVDVFIDGLYQQENDDGVGLRGSTNQNVWHITNRLGEYNFTTLPRRSEIHIQDGMITMVGVPESSIVQMTQKLEQPNVWT